MIQLREIAGHVLHQAVFHVEGFELGEFHQNHRIERFILPIAQNDLSHIVRTLRLDMLQVNGSAIAAHCAVVQHALVL